jgi:hypothetical protein
LEDYRLQIADCGLRITDYGLTDWQIADWQIADYRLEDWKIHCVAAFGGTDWWIVRLE